MSSGDWASTIICLGCTVTICVTVCFCIWRATR